MSHLLSPKQEYMTKESEGGIKAGSLQSEWVEYCMDEKLTEALSSEAEVQRLMTLEVGENWNWFRGLYGN